MAVLHKSVLGTFTNKVGGVVGSSWKGIPVVRSLPASVANPRTAAQMTQRMRFALMINFATLILSGWIRALWNRDAKRMSGFNAFVRANIGSFNLDGNIVLSQLIASRGRLLAPVDISTTGSGASFAVNITHPTNDRYATANDEIYLLIWENTSQRLLYAGGTGAVRGNQATTTVAIALTTTGARSIWAAYRHPRGIFTSSAYFTTTDPGTAVVTPTSEFLFEFARKMKIDVSNIDTSLDEVSAVAVLKEAIKEKAAMNEVTIRSEAEIDVIPTPDKHPYEPEGLDILAEKDSYEVDYERGEMDSMAPMTKRGGGRGNR